MKLIIGWLKVKTGKRDEFLATVQDPWLTGTRAEDGCAFLELLPSRDDPDVAVLTEGFNDEASHVAHSKLPHQVWMQEQLERYVAHARFEIFFSDQHTSHTMGAPTK